MVDNEKLSDVALLGTTGPPLRCHSVILCRISRYMQRRISEALRCDLCADIEEAGSHSTRPGILISEPQVPRQVLLGIVHYLYVEKLPETALSEETLECIALHAKRMEIHTLSILCYRRLLGEQPSLYVSGNKGLAHSLLRPPKLGLAQCVSWKALSDVHLLVRRPNAEQLRIPLHACILALRSHFFHSLFGVTNNVSIEESWQDGADNVSVSYVTTILNSKNSILSQCHLICFNSNNMSRHGLSRLNLAL